MNPLVSRAIHGADSIATLVEDFYGPRGPLAAADATSERAGARYPLAAAAAG